MTKISLTKQKNHIVKVVAQGHTDFSVEGEDIVCAAVSSVIQTALLGLLQVASIPVQYKKDDEEGFLEFSLPEINESDRQNADMILNTMAAGIQDLNENFSKFIKVKAINA